MDMHKTKGVLELLCYFIISAFLLITMLGAPVDVFNLVYASGCFLITTVEKRVNYSFREIVYIFVINSIIGRIQRHIHQKRSQWHHTHLWHQQIFESELPALSPFKEPALLYMVLCTGGWLEWRMRICYNLGSMNHHFVFVIFFH